jgi:hypothetical protein
MRRPKRFALPAGLCAVLLTGLSPGAAIAAETGWVVASAQAQQHLGLKTATLSAAHHKSQIDAFAKVLDPGPLAQLNADLLGAVAAESASKAEASRSRALNAAGASVSAKDAEAAEAQARSDETKLNLLRQRIGLEWGPGISHMSDRQREALIHALAAGNAALLHVDTPSNEGQAGARTVLIDVGSDSVRGVVLGAARQAEPRLQSSGLLVEVTGRSAILLSIGLTQSAHIENGGPEVGVVVPREALIRYRGLVWAYVRSDPSHFQRRLVDGGEPEDAGLFVTQGFTPGEAVVVQGASAIFATEMSRPAARVN